MSTGIDTLPSAVAEELRAHYQRSVGLRRAGDRPGALEMAQKAVALCDRHPQAMHHLGLCCMDLQDFASAATHLERATKLDPQRVEARYHLGVVYETMRRTQDAKREYRRVLDSNPDHVGALEQLGQILVSEIDYPGAENCGKRLLALDANSPVGLSYVAIGLVGQNKPEQAEAQARRLIELDPEDAGAQALYGTILQALGRMKESEAYLRRSIELEPLQGYTYYAHVRTHTLEREEASFVEQMQRVFDNPMLDPGIRPELAYALGKSKSDFGDFAQAMSYYDAANRLVRELRFGQDPFDRTAFAAATDAAIRSFGLGSGIRRNVPHLADNTPIFVVGMMRSGTTLVEQILSCHPTVGAAGEQRFWLDHREHALQLSRRSFGSEQLAGIAAQYLMLLRQLAPGKSRVVDKMPGNYMHLGLLHLLFPNAIFLHVRRNPVDTCLSIWTTPNTALLPWANDKGDVVFVYQEYLRLVEHWRRVVPADRLLDVDYELLVSDSERTTRAMIAHCGLTWNDACVRPQDNQRAVATPSAWQVRQPIYTTAVERWRSFEPWLGEFDKLRPK